MNYRIIDSCMSQWILPQPFFAFSQVTYLHFAYANRGRPYDSEGGGEGLALCGNKYSDLENAENNLSSFVEKINTFLQWGGGGANFP